jgi:DnaJ-class molecular chaperone
MSVLEEKAKKKVKIVCHTCDGKGVITEREYPTFKHVMVVCPECNGEGWIYAELPKVKWNEEREAEA